MDQSSDYQTKSSKSALPTILGLAFIIFGLDQITKFWVLQNIPYGHSWKFWPDFAEIIQFTYIRNTGAAFGLFPQMGTVLLIIAIIVVLGIVFFHRLLPVETIWVRLSLGLQLGGASGNLLDRIIHGFVVDFIDISIFPIFNIADASIVCGVAILAYLLWNEDQPAKDSEITSEPETPSQEPSLSENQPHSMS